MKYPSPGPVLKHADKEALVKSSPQVDDEQSFAGSMPDPEEVDEKDTLEDAQDVGFATNADEEHPEELKMGENINKAEEEIKNK